MDNVYEFHNECVQFLNRNNERTLTVRHQYNYIGLQSQ